MEDRSREQIAPSHMTVVYMHTRQCSHTYRQHLVRNEATNQEAHFERKSTALVIKKRTQIWNHLEFI